MFPGKLFIVSAPSGGGKTSLTRALIPLLAQDQRAAAISVSYTTRAPRPGERDGEHYHFVSDARFREMIAGAEFLEHAEVFGRRYGTGRAKTEELLKRGCDVMLDIDWQGARQVRDQVPDSVGVFILPPSRDELERRLRARAQDDDRTIGARMAAARDEMAHHAEYEYLIVNAQFDQALDQLAAIVHGTRQPGLASELRHALQAARHAALIAELLA